MSPNEKTACEDVIIAHRQTLDLLNEVVALLNWMPEALDQRIKDNSTLAQIAQADLLRLMEGSQK